MLPNIDCNELPRALQRMLTPGKADKPTMLPRRGFLKLAGAGGLALGIFPHLAAAQGPTAARERARSSRHSSRRLSS
jgi:isoquinoline 1-oxidoreductase subunit beta